MGSCRVVHIARVSAVFWIELGSSLQPPTVMPTLPAPTPSAPGAAPGAWFGMRAGDKGTHTSRTIMLAELTDLLKVVPANAEAREYQQAIVQENLLGKKTLATRRLTAQRLSELYGLDPAIPCFRVLRQLWPHDHAGRPMIAFLTAFSRDPLLRATVNTALGAAQGSPVPTSSLDAELASKLGERLNAEVRHKVARNAASSWTQAGYLKGRTNKVRSSPVLTPSVVALALLMGYASGIRGGMLFSTEWIRLLDTSPSQISTYATLAARQSLIDYKHLGEVVELRFPALLTPVEEGLAHV
jgi:hypothetical protein